MPKKAVKTAKKVTQEQPVENNVVDLETRRSKAAEQQRRYRARTGYSYDKAYKKAQEAAMRRLAKEKPKAFRRLFNEERAKVGLGPVQERKRG